MATTPRRPVRTLNLGILAHVDAGKTSLTERLLHHAGVIAEPGSVDRGDTQTDTLALERARGITIKAAVVSFELGTRDRPVTVNLVDTPGHSDFIAEVERSLAVLDGAVLVVSAVEGVQAQTRVLMRALRRLGIPTLLFVNKIDRMGARTDEVLAEIAERLVERPLAMGQVHGPGTREAGFDLDDPSSAGTRARRVDVLSETDERLLGDWLETPARVSDRRLHRALRDQIRGGDLCPVYFGSAMTGVGVPEIAAAVTELLPARRREPSGPLAATVFAVQRGEGGEKVALLSIASGSVSVRDRIPVHDGQAVPGDRDAVPSEARVTSLAVYAHGGIHRVPRVEAGHIARVVGLESARIGDIVGDLSMARPLTHEFSPPTLETVVEPCHTADRSALYTALTRLAEQDPLIDLRRDEVRGETHVSLYGEVQKEVIGATLADEYGIAAAFSETSVICIERVVGTGAAVEFIDVAPNPFLATVGLQVDPGERDSGVGFCIEVELGSMPPAFFTAVEETVHSTLDQGLHGWRVTDLVVTMTHSGYWPRQSHMHQKFDKSMSSTAGDFRHLTPLVLMAALRQAGTVVEEPVHRFDLEVPSDVLGATLTMLAHVRATPRDTMVLGDITRLRGEVPAERLHELQQRVPGLTSGLGDLVCSFDGYRPTTGPPASHSRTDFDPLHRREYLLRVAGKL